MRSENPRSKFRKRYVKIMIDKKDIKNMTARLAGIAIPEIYQENTKVELSMNIQIERLEKALTELNDAVFTLMTIAHVSGPTLPEQEKETSNDLASVRIAQLGRFISDIMYNAENVDRVNNVISRL